MRRLSQAGFKKDFVRAAILPDWWDESCNEDSGLVQDIEIRVARFLGSTLTAVADADAMLVPPAYPQAQLRRVRDIDRDRLGPAIHSAMQIAAAVVRSLRDTPPGPAVLPANGLAWRELIDRTSLTLTLDDLVADLWGRGIPVVPLEVLPTPSFQGMACVVEGRPVILLGHRHEEPGRVAFLVAHEAGHIAAGDCVPDRPVVDEDEEITDNAEIERRADLYAASVLVGGDSMPNVDGADAKDLARQAFALERSNGVDASAMIFAWARRTGDYAKATMAVNALYRGGGARMRLRLFFDLHVDLAAATESDRALLRCVHGDPHGDEAAG